jgi:hypothetical protein
MSEIIKKRERYDYLIDELTSLEIKLSEHHSEHNQAGDNDFRRSIILKDIQSVKKELESLEGIHGEYEKLIEVEEENLRKDSKFKEYLVGFDKANHELDNKIEDLVQLLKMQKNSILNIEEYLKENTLNKEEINKELSEIEKTIRSYQGYEIKEKIKKLSNDTLDNWRVYQDLVDSKEEVQEIINSLIAQKLELKKVKDEFISEKLEE